MVAFLPGVAAAQHGSASSGYFPQGYFGDTFTGTVVKTTDNTISLQYAHGDKTQAFEGRIDSPCTLPVSKVGAQDMSLAAIKPGAVVMAYYVEQTVKADGRKQKENHVIALSFRELEGKPVTEKQDTIFYCVPKGTPMPFRAFR
jgi:hypothetical protein